MELCDEYLHDCIKLDPSINDFLKYKQYENLRHIQRNYYSVEYDKKLEKLSKKYLGILKKKDDKNYYDKILERDLKYEKQYYNFKIYDYMPLSSNSNFFYVIPEIINNDSYFKLLSKNDIEIFIKRLKKLDIMTDTIITDYKKGIKFKKTMYIKNVDELIKTLENILKNKSYEFKKNVPLKKKLNDTIIKYYVKNVNKLLLFLITEYYPNASDKLGLYQYTGGKDLYRLIVKDITLDIATPENIYEMGLFELKRLLKEKEKLVGKDEKKFIEQNSSGKTRKNILNTLEKIKKELYENNNKYFHNNLKENELYKIKKFAKHNEIGIAYYYPTDFNKIKKGTFYINLNNQAYDINELKVLSLHEGIPGHHYQLERLLNNKKIPDYIKFNSNTCYVEGWGLYSENLYEYEKKIEYYYKLKYEIIRSIRLIIDTGIHYYGWSYEKCYNFMDKYLEKNDIQEITRYISSPGQAISYKIGEKIILFLKDKYLEKYPGKLKDFNELILDIGPCPMDILIERVKNLIKI
jgi:uncharacterized protein (DUF885 family)